MKTSFLLSLILLTQSAVYAQQYNLFETTLTCDKTQKEWVVASQKRIKQIFEGMVKEGRMINFTSNLDQQKDKIILSFTMAAENEVRFKELRTEWEKRFNLSESSQDFWKACPKRKDSIMNNLKVMYPLIKDLWAPVAVVEGIDELPDPKLNYNIVVDFTAFPTLGENKNKMDSSSSNWGLSDIGRIYNLHLAAGIPKEKIHFVVAVHAFAARSFLKNEEYKKRYKIDNPNLAVIEELDKAGVKFLVCGQSLNWMGDKKEMLLPQAKVSLTAQTTLTSYQLKGYALKPIRND
jgi:intracellular sulfur oxidation DsrE/DsrF family protein